MGAEFEFKKNIRANFLSIYFSEKIFYEKSKKEIPISKIKEKTTFVQNENRNYFPQENTKNLF